MRAWFLRKSKEVSRVAQTSRAERNLLQVSQSAFIDYRSVRDTLRQKRGVSNEKYLPCAKVSLRLLGFD